MEDRQGKVIFILAVNVVEASEKVDVTISKNLEVKLVGFLLQLKTCCAMTNVQYWC